MTTDQIETGKPFGKYEEILLIPTVLYAAPQYATEITRLIEPEMFASPHARYVFAMLRNYEHEHGIIPPPGILEDIIMRHLTADDDYEEVVRIIKLKPDPRASGHMQKRLLDFAKEKTIKELYADETLIAIERGEHHVAQEIMDRFSALSTASANGFGWKRFSDLKAHLDDDEKWLVTDVLAADGNCFVGGHEKVLKTGILCDLAVSLATGKCFLGRFGVPKARKVAYFSAEMGERPTTRRIDAIARAKHLDDAAIDRNLLLNFEPPDLSNQEYLGRLTQELKRQQVEAVIIDPLYMCLFQKDGDKASNFFSTGGVFAKINKMCQQTGTTIILAHHFKATAPVGRAGLDMHSFSYVGPRECRQSILVGRHAEYTGPTDNQLLLKLHGQGRGELYRVHVDEGEEGENWRVTVTEDGIQASAERAKELADKEANLSAKVANALLELAEAGEEHVTANRLREFIGMSGRDVKKGVECAVKEGVAEYHQQVVGGRLLNCIRRIN